MPINMFSKVPLLFDSKNHLLWMSKVHVQRNESQTEDIVFKMLYPCKKGRKSVYQDTVELSSRRLGIWSWFSNRSCSSAAETRGAAVG